MDAIFALGSDSTRVAHRAVDLWHAGYGTYLIVSGGRAERSLLGKTEGEIFADIARARNVPEEYIIVENAATNTGENITLVRQLLKNRGYTFRSLLLVQKPYLERRVYAAFCKLWPEAQCRVTSPWRSFKDYTPDTAARDRLAHHLVGTLFRIQDYPQRGYQIPQIIPQDVLAAYDRLRAEGYCANLPQPLQ